MATIKDVAALAGVSFTTVSHVINNTRTVAPETRARVEEAIKKLGYAPSVIARGLRCGESKTVGVVSIANSDPYFAQVLHGVQERGWEVGFGVFISHTELVDVCPTNAIIPDDDRLADREDLHLGDLTRRNVQGIILNSLQTDRRLAKTLNAIELPCILFQRLLTGPKWDTFMCDDFQGTADAMSHLIALGHRRIGVVEGFGYESHSVKHRKRAWQGALEAAGLEADPTLVADGQYDAEAAYHATKGLLSARDRPTAILFYSDVMALAGIRAATDLGLSIPRDLSVVGYDNLVLDDYTVPRLTSVSQQSARIGRDMMSRLADRIADPSIEPIVRTYPQELVVRESTGPVPV
jgi:LacI family transcriptional regulator